MGGRPLGVKCCNDQGLALIAEKGIPRGLSCTPFAPVYASMSDNRIHLNSLDGRDGRVGGKVTDAEVCHSLFNPAVNLGSRKNADWILSVSFPYGMQPTGLQFTINHLKTNSSGELL